MPFNTGITAQKDPNEGPYQNGYDDLCQNKDDNSKDKQNTKYDRSKDVRLKRKVDSTTTKI